jgi:IS5 family transposase
VIRDLARRTSDDQELRQAFAYLLSIARRVLEQDYRQRGRKIYSLHAPEVECIGKGKAHRPYEFGVKVSVSTTLQRSRGGQFVAHIATLPGNPYDGDHPQHGGADWQQAERILADAGYRGHNASPDYKFRIYTAGQKRRVTPQIKREMRRRAAIEPVIGHLKAEHRMDCNHLAHASDTVNAILAAAGYNFSLLLTWLGLLLFRLLIQRARTSSRCLKSDCHRRLQYQPPHEPTPRQDGPRRCAPLTAPHPGPSPLPPRRASATARLESP